MSLDHHDHPPDEPNVLLVDDHHLLAETLALALRQEGVRAETAPLDGPAAVIAAAERMPADLVVLDLDLGGVIGDGALLVAPLVQTGARVLVLTGSAASARVGSAVELGAVGALRKDVPLEELLRVVLAATRGEAVTGLQDRRDLIALARAERRRATEAAAPFRRLSVREAQVLWELAQGHGVTEIAQAWHLAEATVRSQVRGVLTKLDVRSQLEAVALARRAGWLDDVPAEV